MSDESQHHPKSAPRSLRPEEVRVLAALLGSSPTATDHSVLVEDMADGGMGSIRFARISGESRSLSKAIAKAEYVDADGVLVSIVVNIDEQGDLYELDFWKVDFSPLREYPKPEQLQVKTGIRPHP